MMLTKFTLICLAAAIGNTSCTPFKDKPQLATFALRHPIAAIAIGQQHPNANNITSNAVRLSTRIGLDNDANGDGRGTEVNAIRHSLWQAAISARFGTHTAQQAGNAYERNPILHRTLHYPNRYSADEAADLRNNAIGRRIGSTYPAYNMNSLTAILLQEYVQNGLWTAFPIQKNGNTEWQITKNKLPTYKYRTALKKLAKLDANGMTKAEQIAQKNHTRYNQ